MSKNTTDINQITVDMLNKDPNKIYAYTVFDTTKNKPHYSTIKKCIDFKNYTTHKLIINKGGQSEEYTFLRLVYNRNTINTSIGTIGSTNYASNFDSWNLSGSNNFTQPCRDIEKVIEEAESQSVIGTSLFDLIGTILDSINKSDSVQIDKKIISLNDNNTHKYIYLIMNEIFKADPLLLISMFICPRKYFLINNYDIYFSHFITILDELKENTKNQDYNLKFGVDRSTLLQIAKIFERTIDSDYLFLTSDVLRNMLDFIINVGIKDSRALDDNISYTINNTKHEIIITGRDDRNDIGEERRVMEQRIMYDTVSYVNPYRLVKPIQYINLKLISENKKSISLVFKNTKRELFNFSDLISQDREASNELTQYWQLHDLNGFGYEERRPYAIGRKSAVKYSLMSKILNNKQKKLFLSTLISLVRNMKPEEEFWPDSKYTYGTSLIKEALTELIGESVLEQDTTFLDLLVNNFTSENEKRSIMLLKLYNSLRDNSRLAALILNYITDEEILDKDTFDAFNAHVSINNSFNAKWFNKNKSIIVKSLKERYTLSSNINDDQLFAFYLFTHCNEFIKKDFISSVTESIIKNKHSSAFDSLVDDFFKKNSSNVLAFLDELKSSLMKDLFINIYTLKASQQMFLWAMSDDISVSSEAEIILKESLKLSSIKSTHYVACENLLIAAYKSTNSFKGKIIDMLKENVISKPFGGEKKKINNDARIALFADLLRALNNSHLTPEEQGKIANHYDNTSRWNMTILPYYIDDISGVMKAISLVPNCNTNISVFYTEKYLQEH